MGIWEDTIHPTLGVTEVSSNQTKASTSMNQVISPKLLLRLKGALGEDAAQ